MYGRLARVGVTGGIAEGKSTVLRYLREAGYHTASADDVARKVLSEPGARAEVARIARLTDSYEPTALRESLLADSGVRRAVNAFLHPRVLAILAGCGAEFMEVPLLVETALQPAFDEVWVVTCGAAEQRRRLIVRLGDERLADRLIATQLPTSAKLAFADRIVDTTLSRRSVKALALEAASSTKKLGVAKRAK